MTEVRPGTYVVSDYMMTERGVTHYDEVALSVRCTVVGRPASDTARVDVGSKTIATDISPARENLRGYARAVGPDAYVEGISEEHGIVHLLGGADLRIGDRVAFYPTHVCTTVKLAAEIIGLRGGRIVKIWPIAAKGKRR